MKNIAILFLFFPFYFSSQSIEEIDQLTFSLCETLNKSGYQKSDSMKLQDAFDQNIPMFAAQFKVKDFSEELLNKIFMRLQKNCDEYQKINNRLHPNDVKSDWKILDIKPVSKISAEKCNIYFKKYQKFYYYEANGEQTKVAIKKGIWTETFVVGTTSKLYFTKNDCKFELQFIESNNETRRDFSIKGDHYFYEVISLEDKVVTVVCQSEKSKSFYQFKMYPLD